jgi:hypothetical protein
MSSPLTSVQGAEEALGMFVEGFERFIVQETANGMARDDIFSLLYHNVVDTYDNEKVGLDRMMLLLTAAIYQLTEAKQSIAGVMDGNRRTHE